MTEVTVTRSVNDLAREYYALSQQIKTQENALDELKAQLKATMKEAGATSLVTGPYKISYCSVSTQRVDTKKVKELLQERFAEFATTVTSERITVTKSEE